MKYLTIVFIVTLSFKVQAKKVESHFVCPIDNDFKVELSMLDPKVPTVDLFYKKIKFGTCFYDNTIYSTMKKPGTQVTSNHWRFKKNSCRYYFEEHKNKIAVIDEVMFINGDGRKESYLRIVEEMQPLKCSAN